MHTMDFQVVENGKDKYNEKAFAGDTRPEDRDNFKYIGVEEH